MMDFCEKNSGIPGIHPDSERSDRKRKNVKSVISIIIHNRKTQCRGACNRSHNNSGTTTDQSRLYRSTA